MEKVFGEQSKKEMEELKNLVFADITVTIKSAMKEADVKQLEALADELLGK